MVIEVHKSQLKPKGEYVVEHRVGEGVVERKEGRIKHEAQKARPKYVDLRDRSDNRHLAWTCGDKKCGRTFCDHYTCMKHMVKEHPRLCEPEWLK